MIGVFNCHVVSRVRVGIRGRGYEGPPNRRFAPLPGRGFGEGGCVSCMGSMSTIEMIVSVWISARECNVDTIDQTIDK